MPVAGFVNKNNICNWLISLSGRTNWNVRVISISSISLEIMQRTDITKETADVFIELAHFAFSTGSKEKVDAMIEQFRSDGYKIVGEPRITGDGYYEGAVLDPDGNIVEVIA